MCILSFQEELHFLGWNIILFIQDIFKDYTDIILLFNKAGDPRYAFLLFFPFAYAVHRPTGSHVLWIACVSEWLNAVSKWFLYGDRPYWWVQETFHWKTPEELNGQLPKQFYLTCETGPGIPSGHAMVTSAVLYVMFAAFIKHRVIKQSLQFLVWLVFGLYVLAICFSRVYIATHFPHQVLVGAGVGLVLGTYIEYGHVAKAQLHHYIGFSCVLGIGAWLTFYGLSFFGLDPMWSVAKAKKWCADPGWIHLDTTLFFSVLRDVGCLLGFGFGDYFSQKVGVANQSTSATVKSLQVCSSLLLTLSLGSIKLSFDSEVAFYITSFFLHFAMMFSVTVIIPYLLKVARLSTENSLQKEELKDGKSA